MYPNLIITPASSLLPLEKLGFVCQKNSNSMLGVHFEDCMIDISDPVDSRIKETLILTPLKNIDILQ